MDYLHQLLDFVRDPRVQQEAIRWGGYWLLSAIVFSETGLLVGFFLPGDSLLFSAGVVAAMNPEALDVRSLVALLCVMAVAGDATGFAFGRWTGHALYERRQSFFFRRDHLLAARDFYEKHGGKTIILARFMPFVRTFAPIVAGIAGMPYRRFFVFNVMGGVGWVVSMTLLGYFLGSQLSPGATEKAIILIILASVAPLFIGWLRRRLRARSAAAQG